MSDFYHILIFATVISSAAVGGIFFAFSGFVMRALARISADRGIAAMQSINVVVQSFPFFLFFFGTGVMCVVLMVWTLMNGGIPGTGFVLGGGVLYVIGGIGVTVACNVPLNLNYESAVS